MDGVVFELIINFLKHVGVLILYGEMISRFYEDYSRTIRIEETLLVHPCSCSNYKLFINNISHAPMIVWTYFFEKLNPSTLTTLPLYYLKVIPAIGCQTLQHASFPAKEWEIILLLYVSNFYFIRKKSSLISQQCLCHLIQVFR